MLTEKEFFARRYAEAYRYDYSSAKTPNERKSWTAQYRVYFVRSGLFSHTEIRDILRAAKPK